MTRLKTLTFTLLIMLLSSCTDTITKEIGTKGDGEFSFDESFQFNTSKELAILTNNTGSTFELYFLDNQDKHHYLGKFYNTSSIITVSVPSYVTQLNYIDFTNESPNASLLNLNVGQTVVEVPINSGRGRTTSDENCIDHLYAVNNNSGFYKIDVTTDDFVTTTLPTLPGGSIANALDQDNGLVYINIGQSLYQYDVENETFEVQYTSNPYNGSYPRFEYREDTFYMGNNTTMYTVKASTNEVIQQYTISGFINNNGGGDLAFASDGTLYLACFSGLYKFTEINDDTGIATIERISAENFPFQLTSMAIDRQDRIFVGTNDANSRLIEISKEDGAYTIVRTYDHKINDLTAWKCDFSNINVGSESDNDGDGVTNEEDDDMDGDGIIDEKDDDVDGDGIKNSEDSDIDGDGISNEEDSDIDGDGVANQLDDYPDDPIASSNVYTPSKLGYGTIAFEDNWPSKGDYDFNDLIVQYKVTSKINRDNEAIQMVIELILSAAGGEFQNGFGIELPIDASLIESVTGHNAPASMLNNQGLENNQANPTIIAFTNALAELGGGNVINADPNKSKVDEKVYTIVIDFNELIAASELANAPFNPFTFINNDRGRECHLKDMTPTSLADTTYYGTADDYSDANSNRYYVSEDNVPFGINISHSFRYPVEGARIDRAYNYFLQWGQSSGGSYSDWYTDANGYRNTSNIYTK